VSERNEKGRQIDYIFARYPLWIRYSKLPGKLGPGPWCIFQRLLELMERFGSPKFRYSLERLGDTAGVNSRLGVRKILKKLEEEGLIRYTPQQGRGKESQFEILLPIKAPLSEEDVYHIHPRLRSKSYQKSLEEYAKKDHNVTLLGEKKDHNVILLDQEKDHAVTLLEDKKDHNVTVFGNNVILLGKNDGQENVATAPFNESQKNAHDKDKKTCIKRQQQQKDLFISGTPDDPQDVPKLSELNNDNAVVAPNTQNLKEYGISGELAERYTRMYAPHYIEDKIEIIEYKRFKGEQIRNPGGMLKKAIEEDWQRPEGFSTRAQREEAARAAKEAEKAEKLKEKERLENIRREEETAAAAEEWRKAAAPGILARIRERAVKEVKARFPDTDESLLRVPIRLEENKIIAKEFLSPDSS